MKCLPPAHTPRVRGLWLQKLSTCIFNIVQSCSKCWSTCWLQDLWESLPCFEVLYMEQYMEQYTVSSLQPSACGTVAALLQQFWAQSKQAQSCLFACMIFLWNCLDPKDGSRPFEYGTLLIFSVKFCIMWLALTCGGWLNWFSPFSIFMVCMTQIPDAKQETVRLDWGWCKKCRFDGVFANRLPRQDTSLVSCGWEHTWWSGFSLSEIESFSTMYFSEQH